MSIITRTLLTPALSPSVRQARGAARCSYPFCFILQKHNVLSSSLNNNSLSLLSVPELVYKAYYVLFSLESVEPAKVPFE